MSNYYDASDGCDCSCGVVDPDCAEEPVNIYNCKDDQVCSVNGTCVSPNSRVVFQLNLKLLVCGNWIVESSEQCERGLGCGSNCTCQTGYTSQSNPLLLACIPSWCVVLSIIKNLSLRRWVGCLWGRLVRKCRGLFK